MSKDKAEFNAYIRYEWKNDRTWMKKELDHCQKKDIDILGSFAALIKEVNEVLDESYGWIACSI